MNDALLLMLQQLGFCALVFATVALLVCGSVRAFGRGEERQRLRSRLIDKKPKAGKKADAGQPTLLSTGEQQSALRQMLARYSFTQELESSLKQATGDVTVERFLTVCAAIGAVLGTMMFLVQYSLIAAVIGFVVGGYLPFLWLGNRRMRRQRMIAEQLPDGLDFLGRSLRAGHSFPVGLQMMGDELPNPLCEEFGRCHDEISLGQPPEAALKGMTERIESNDFAFFVTAVMVQRQTGGDLAQVLDNITGMLRQRIQLAQNLQAKTAEGRFTGFILAAFPMVMFVIMYLMSPENAGVLITTTSGKMMLGAAIALCAMGLFVIRKITAVKL